MCWSIVVENFLHELWVTVGIHSKKVNEMWERSLSFCVTQGVNELAGDDAREISYLEPRHPKVRFRIIHLFQACHLPFGSA